MTRRQARARFQGLHRVARLAVHVRRAADRQKRAQMALYIQSKIAESLSGFVGAPPRHVELPPPEGCIRARLDTRTGEVSVTLKAPLKRIMLDLTFEGSGL